MRTIYYLIVFFNTMLITNITMQAQTVAGKKILIAYFSQSGNTQEVANQIKNVTGGDMFRIEPMKAYPTEYQVLTEQAKKEINAGYKPVLKNKLKDISSYDIIFVGSPCWWSTFAPPVTTFLTSYDFTGKTIIPFMTHEGSRMGRTVADMRKLCPKAKVLEGLPIRGGQAKNAQAEVKKWVSGIIK